MSKKWKIANEKIIESALELEKQLLVNRGIKTEKQKKEFFNPKMEDYEKDFNLSGIAIAKKRILKAIKNQELIIVYGDYDADGICGTAVLYLGLSSLGATVLPYIPHREKEGYGLSEEGLDDAKAQGASLVITVDNGIVAIKQAKYAKKIGLDLIITDHHLPLDKKPDALAIVHSTKMCGTAAGWCLVKKLVTWDLAQELLDLVALATIADMVPLLGVNRVLVKAGLKQMNQTKKVGLLALIKDAGLNLGSIGTYEVGYIIGPRLNAKGRLEHALDALRLLCTKDLEKAKKLAKILSDTNDKKKQLVEDAILEAREMIKISYLGSGMQKKILVLHSKNWIPGIVGLVAGRIAEEYNLPTIAISLGEIESKGSARSIKGVNIVETIRMCSEFLIDVGGHPQAAGFTLETTKIETFKQKLEKTINNIDFEKDGYLEIEAVLNCRQISKKWITEIQ
ncbi:MAG: single-stranded-DNA-specific exonuclease RecJ, partial [Candidatus Daviesbacteria bacterium]|nr:single-stranded-DNA-specific exonuclease RecJ [Candidatus Daviesbacteria bacterium]